MDLSIIIPLHNEARRLPGCVEKITRWIATQPISVEIVFIENGSTDDTLRIARAYMMQHANIRVYSLDQRGKGAAVRYGMLLCNGRYRMMADCDWSMPVSHVADFWILARPGAVLIGDRAHPRSQVLDRLPRRLIGTALNRLIQALLLPGLNDTQCGFKLFPAAIALDLFSCLTLPGMGFDLEILYLARQRGYTIESIPITWVADPDSRVTLADGLEFMRDALKIRQNWRAGRYAAAQNGQKI